MKDNKSNITINKKFRLNLVGIEVRQNLKNQNSFVDLKIIQLQLIQYLIKKKRPQTLLYFTLKLASLTFINLILYHRC